MLNTIKLLLLSLVVSIVSANPILLNFKKMNFGFLDQVEGQLASKTFILIRDRYTPNRVKVSVTYKKASQQCTVTAPQYMDFGIWLDVCIESKTIFKNVTRKFKLDFEFSDFLKEGEVEEIKLTVSQVKIAKRKLRYVAEMIKSRGHYDISKRIFNSGLTFDSKEVMDNLDSRDCLILGAPCFSEL